MNPCSRPFQRVLTSLLLVAAATMAHAYKWPEWDRSELAETHGQVDPEAGAEVILETVVVDHSSGYDLSEEHYRRIRIYNASGLEGFAKIEIPYERGSRVTGIMARTIKPDGTILELGRKDIVDREIVKAGRERIRVKAFAPVGLEPGVILEYRYVREPEGSVTWIAIQGPVPVRKFVCRVSPYPSALFRMASYIFHCPNTTGFKLDEKSGWSTFEHANVPAMREEPFSPPEIETKASVLLYYRPFFFSFHGLYWFGLSSYLYDEGKQITKRSKTIQAAVASIVAPADPPEEKVHKLYDFCRTQIENRDSGALALSADDRKKLPKNKTPSDTLKNRSGGADEINALLVAMASAAGLEAQLAIFNDRSMMIANPENVSEFTMYHRVAAVKLPGKWTFYDPGKRNVPFGFLPWQFSDTCYVLADEKGGSVKVLEGPKAEKSVQRRHATLTLDSAGTLEGDVELRYTGLCEADARDSYFDRTPEEREKSLKDEIQGNLPRADITDVRFDNADNPLEPLKVSYHIRVPAYAEKIGSRLFLQPAFFEKGLDPMFTAKTRESDIAFKYRRTEEDEVTITIPEGFSIEARSAPMSQSFQALGFYRVQLGIGRDPRTIVYKRTLSLEMIGIQAKFYDALRTIFEFVHGQDNHLITVKRENEGSEEPAEAASTGD